MIKEFLFGISSALAETTGAAAAGTAADGAAVAAEEMAMSPVAAILQLVLPLVLMGAVFYFMLIRPQRKKDKQVKEMLNNLKHGDRITTIGGIYGTITGIKDDKEIQPYIDFIMNEYNEGRGKPNGEIIVVPTPNGSHLLVTPFDVRNFKKRWPDIEIHKDNPTVLYYGG